MNLKNKQHVNNSRSSIKNKGQVKAEVQDAFVTDRYIYSLNRKVCTNFNEKTRLCK